MKDAGWSKELEGKQLEEELNQALTAARAWMEITPENAEERSSDTLQVGETALLTVKSTLPGRYLCRPINIIKLIRKLYDKNQLLDLCSKRKNIY